MGARELAIEAEIAALDAWRDAACAKIWTNVGTMDHGGYGCESNNNEDEPPPHDNSGIHDERCPVEVARKALFAATDRRRSIPDRRHPFAASPAELADRLKYAEEDRDEARSARAAIAAERRPDAATIAELQRKLNAQHIELVRRARRDAEIAHHLPIIAARLQVLALEAGPGPAPKSWEDDPEIDWTGITR